MRLFIVRHCEAAPDEVDDLRPLTAAGRDAARELATQLAPEQPTVVLCSPLLRARETAQAIATACGLRPEPDERLAPGMTMEDVREAVEGRGDTIVVVAHNPDCSDLVQRLTGDRPSFAPGAFVEVRV